MFTVKSLLAFAALAVFPAIAAPAPAPLEARDDICYIKYCKDHYFQGQCLTVGVRHDQCFGNLSTEWNDVISSYEVLDRNAWTCRFYEHASCQGAYYDSQKDDTLHDGNGAWADRISSIMCWKKTTTNPNGPCAPFC